MPKVSELVKRFEKMQANKESVEIKDSKRNIFRKLSTNNCFNYKMQAVKDWAISRTKNYDHVKIKNFSSSWSDGMAFCAVVHSYFPEEFDYSELKPDNRKQNFEIAFSAAKKLVNCDPLLDVEDMIAMGNRPDSKSVFVYVSFLRQKLIKAAQTSE